MISKLLLTLLFALAFSTAAPRPGVAGQAQNKSVSGKVTGADDGLPLPQVSVFYPKIA